VRPLREVPPPRLVRKRKGSGGKVRIPVARQHFSHHSDDAIVEPHQKPRFLIILCVPNEPFFRIVLPVPLSLTAIPDLHTVFPKARAADLSRAVGNRKGLTDVALPQGRDHRVEPVATARWQEKKMGESLPYPCAALIEEEGRRGKRGRKTHLAAPAPTPLLLTALAYHLALVIGVCYDKQSNPGKSTSPFDDSSRCSHMTTHGGVNLCRLHRSGVSGVVPIQSPVLFG